MYVSGQGHVLNCLATARGSGPSRSRPRKQTWRGVNFDRKQSGMSCLQFVYDLFVVFVYLSLGYPSDYMVQGPEKTTEFVIAK